MLMTAALQPQAEAQKTISDYANSNPQEYAGFKSILSPLGTLQSQCGVQVVPARFQWAFDQFIGS
jgi:hemophore-related protein